jgi:hypothetical protein
MIGNYILLQGPQYGPCKTNIPSCVKHSKEFLSVFGGHLISINVPLRQEEGYILIRHQLEDPTHRHNVFPTFRE